MVTGKRKRLPPCMMRLSKREQFVWQQNRTVHAEKWQGSMAFALMC